MKLKLLTAAALLMAAPALAQSPAFAPTKTLKVTRDDDTGAEGTLRWAIEENNRNPGQYRIELQGGAVIRPLKELPPIIGPVVLENPDHARTGSYASIDGSAYVIGEGTKACPGAVAGQYGTNVRTTTNPGLILRDTKGVEIRGLEVRNFCIGILLNRASDNVIADNLITGNKGGAGIMLTGDDGTGKST
ncbi:MAG: hypothetical protein QM667_07665, partial [Asticcacaulis sp.]